MVQKIRKRVYRSIHTIYDIIASIISVSYLIPKYLDYLPSNEFGTGGERCRDAMRLDERATFGCDVFGTEQTYSILRTDTESSNILVGVHGGEKGIGRKGERLGSRCCALIEYAEDVKVGRSDIAVALAIAIISKLLVIMYYGYSVLCFIGTWFVFIITEFYSYFISGF